MTDEDFAYELRKQNKLDQMTDDEFIELMNISRMTQGRGIPDGDDYELRKLEERGWPTH